MPAVKRVWSDGVSAAEAGALAALYPLQKGKALLAWFRGVREYHSVRREIAQFVVDRAELERLRRENETLRSVLKLRERNPRMFYARALGWFSEGRDEYLVIEKPDGTDPREGAGVLSPQEVLIGVIKTVSANSVTARLLTSPSETIGVRILPSGVEGVLTGDNNGEYDIALVPSGAELHTGDPLVTSGRNNLILPGIPVGVVTDINRREGESFLNVRARAFADAYELDHVVIQD